MEPKTTESKTALMASRRCLLEEIDLVVTLLLLFIAQFQSSRMQGSIGVFSNAVAMTALDHSESHIVSNK